MNHDSLYSELTLKTKTKVVLLVLDGVGTWRCAKIIS